ncbi:MAG TPA: histone deacetylase family protein [Dehalococcoidia bacterium]|nr:histone deacetylase family protein [Dehalococcoidia bacterium]
MKVVYHPRYVETYSYDPAAAPGRMEAIVRELEGKYEFVEPQPASDGDLLLVHAGYHIESVKRDRHLYEIACLAAGGAIRAAQIGMQGEASFGLIRPPGHHASSDHCWGFCYFNNIAVAVAKLRSENLIKTAFILDFDLHFGDGTSNIFGESDIRYFQPRTYNRQKFIEEIELKLSEVGECSVLAVSAGFDRHVQDWGGQLTTEDYHTIGELVKQAAITTCQGRRFAVLEGGYNHDVLGKNVAAFLEGFS